MALGAISQLEKRQIGYVIVCIVAPLLTLILFSVAKRELQPPPAREQVVAPPRPGELEAIEREARAAKATQAADADQADAQPIGIGRPLREAVPLDAIRPEVERHLAALQSLQRDIDHFVADIDSRPIAEHGDFSREVNRRCDAIIATSPLRRLEHGPLWDAIANAETEVRQSWFSFVFEKEAGYRKWRARSDTSLSSVRYFLEASASDTSP